MENEAMMPAGQARVLVTPAEQVNPAGAMYGQPSQQYRMGTNPVSFQFGDASSQYRIGSDGQSAAREDTYAARLLAGTGMTCQMYLARSQAERQHDIALARYALRSHAGERPFNSYPTAMDALSPAEQRQALADIAWLNQHCPAVEVRRLNATVTKSTLPNPSGQSYSIASIWDANAGYRRRPMPLPWIQPGGQASSITTWWSSEPIVLTKKNYVVGFVVGTAVGALGMHLWMGRKKKR